MEDGNPSLLVSENLLLCEPGEEKFVEEHRENQFKVIKHISENIDEICWKEFFDIIDEARKCNIVMVSENSKLQQFQLESGMGEWKSDYEKAKIKLVNMCDPEGFLEFYNSHNVEKREKIKGNVKLLSDRNFSGTKGIIKEILSIIQKEEDAKEP